MNRENNRPTQCEKILRHLRDYNELSSLEAIQEYGILRLASRINELKKRGEKIQVEMRLGKNRYGEKTIFAVYKLEKEQ